LAKNCKFFLPSSHLVLSFGVTTDPLQIYKKAFQFLKLKVFQAADGEDLVILACTVLTDPPVWQTDRGTDRQNCDG